MKYVLTILSFLFLTNVAVTTGADTPFIVRGSKPGTDVVQYPQDPPSAPLEAWEVVLDWADGTYLNYSRGWYGHVGSQTQPIRICSTKVDGKKFAGIGYDESRLQSALALVIQDALGTTANSSTSCSIFSDLLLNHPEYKDLQKFFDSL